MCVNLSLMAQFANMDKGGKHLQFCLHYIPSRGILLHGYVYVCACAYVCVYLCVCVPVCFDIHVLRHIYKYIYIMYNIVSG